MRLLSPARMPAWDDVIASFPGCTVFHSSLWARVLQKTYGFALRYVTWDHEASSGAFPIALVKSGLFGRKAVCSAFSDSCPPLSQDGTLPGDVLQALEHWGRSRNLKSIEFRGGDLSASGLHASREYIEHVIDLRPGVTGVWDNLRSSTQRNIRKAARVGLQATVSQDPRAIETYYRMHCETRRRLGVPPQSRGFFHNVQAFVIAEGHGLVVTAWQSGLPIAAGVFLHFGRQALYKFGASRVEFQEHRPNNLVMWTAIQWYAERGFETLSLGRTDREDVGLLQFKDGWGAVRRPLCYWRLGLESTHTKPAVHQASPGLPVVRRMARRLPIPLLRAIGAMIYPLLA